MRPGIVAVSLSAYGQAGPWAKRRGFDSLVQTASGIIYAEADAAGVLPKPKELPAQALDHAAGYLMAFGAMMALARKAREGGSWHVQVSLARTGHGEASSSRRGLPPDPPSPTSRPARPDGLIQAASPYVRQSPPACLNAARGPPPCPSAHAGLARVIPLPIFGGEG
jgi:hypothetical protein